MTVKVKVLLVKVKVRQLKDENEFLTVWLFQTFPFAL